MRKPLDLELAGQPPLDIGHLFDRDHEIEIEAHHGIDVRIDGLADDDAEPHLTLGQQGQQPIEEVGFVHGHGLPERECTHESTGFQ